MKSPLSLIASAGQKPFGLAFDLSAHPRRHDHLVAMMVTVMVERSHLTFDRKSNAKRCQPEKRAPESTTAHAPEFRPVWFFRRGRAAPSLVLGRRG
jgi:anti-sigma factor RsiW